MGDMALCHDKGIIPDSGFSLFMYTPVDYHMFTNRVVVTYDDIALISFPSEILWCGRDDTSNVEMVVFPYSCAGEDTYVRADVTAVSYYDISVDISERVNCHILSDPGLRMHKGQWAYVTHDNYF